MAVILPSTYTDGTAVCTNGSPNVVGTGTMWLNTILPGDFFWSPSGESVRILAVVDNTHITLAYNWPGATQVTGPYEIRFQADQGRVQETTRQLLERMQSGNLYAFAGLSGMTDTIPYFTGPGAMGILTRQDLTNGVDYDVLVDTLTDRAAYNNEATGFTVLVANVGDGRSAIYAKNSVTLGDWSDPAYITGPVGPLSVLNPRGTYSGVTAYALNDVTLYNGSSFVALQSTTGNAPPTLPTTSNAYWTLIAIKGTDGAGTGDVVGPSSVVDGDLVAFNGVTGKLIKTATMPTGLIKGRRTAGTGIIEDLTPSQVRGLIQTDLIGGMRNKLINGEGLINQRNASSAADDVYGHDRHYALTQTAAIGVSTVSAPATGIRSMMRLTQSQVTAQRMGYAQIVESSGVIGLRGKTVTFGGKLRFSNAAPIRYAILEWTGAADSVTSDVVNSWTSTSYTAGGFFVATNLTVNQVGVITPTAATITDWSAAVTVGNTANNIIVLMWTEGTAAQASTLDIRWYLVDGDATNEADPFGSRNIQQEIALCERFYQFYTGLILGGSVTASGTQWEDYTYTVRMRAAPTIVINNTANTNVSSTSVNLSETNHARIACNVSATGNFFVIFDLTLNAEL